MNKPWLIAVGSLVAMLGLAFARGLRRTRASRKRSPMSWSCTVPRGS